MFYKQNESFGGSPADKKSRSIFLSKLLNCPLPCYYRDTERGGEREIYEWMRDDMAGGKDCFDNYVIFKLQCVLSAWSCKCTNGEQVFSAIQCDQNSIRNCLDLKRTGKVKMWSSEGENLNSSLLGWKASGHCKCCFSFHKTFWIIFSGHSMPARITNHVSTNL